MPEDFGWGGDEFMLGDCQEDWQIYGADRFDERQGLRKLHETQRQMLDELEMEFIEFDDDEPTEEIAVDAEDEEDDVYLDDDDDYLDGSWEE